MYWKDETTYRKTIPIVTGKEIIVKLAISLAISLPIISGIASRIGIYSPILVSITSIVIVITMITSYIIRKTTS
jgi:hypothetical protein